MKLKAIHRFTSTATAVEDVTALQKGKIGKGLKKFLTDEMLNKGKGKDAALLVTDPHLGIQAVIMILYAPNFVFCSSFDIEKTQYQCISRYLRKQRHMARNPKSIGCIA